MNTDLQRQIDELEALDAKRTPGRWGHDLNGHVATIKVDQWEETVAMPPCGLKPPYTKALLSDMDFVAAAPRMMDTIRALRAELEQCEAERAAEREVIEDGCREWQHYVEVDTAPMSCAAYVLRAVDAARTGASHD